MLNSAKQEIQLDLVLLTPRLASSFTNYTTLCYCSLIHELRNTIHKAVARPQATLRFYLAAVEKNLEKKKTNFRHSCEIKSGSGLGQGYKAAGLSIKQLCEVNNNDLVLTLYI